MSTNSVNDINPLPEVQNALHICNLKGLLRSFSKLFAMNSTGSSQSGFAKCPVRMWCGELLSAASGSVWKDS